MKIRVIDKINMKEATKTIQSDELWFFAANEWKRLVGPYVPRKTGTLMNTTDVKPKEVCYRVPYARYMYNGILYVDPKYRVGGFTSNNGATWFSRPNVKKVSSGRSLRIGRGSNPKASKEWDKAAIKDKQDLLLAKSIQKWIDRNL